MKFKTVVKQRLCIGDLMGDAKFLERFDINANGDTELCIGS